MAEAKFIVISFGLLPNKTEYHIGDGIIFSATDSYIGNIKISINSQPW
jgi:hypothetical protein